MIANASSSTKKVPLGTRKLLAIGITAVLVKDAHLSVLSSGWRGSEVLGSLAEDEDEQRHEGQVDEEHRLDQTDRQEEDRLQATLGLGLAGHALDVGRTGQAVTDAGADRATGEGQATADERAGRLDGRFA